MPDTRPPSSANCCAVAMRRVGERGVVLVEADLEDGDHAQRPHLGDRADGRHRAAGRDRRHRVADERPEGPRQLAAEHDRGLPGPRGRPGSPA